MELNEIFVNLIIFILQFNFSAFYTYHLLRKSDIGFDLQNRVPINRSVYWFNRFLEDRIRTVCSLYRCNVAL